MIVIVSYLHARYNGCTYNRIHIEIVTIADRNVTSRTIRCVPRPVCLSGTGYRFCHRADHISSQCVFGWSEYRSITRRESLTYVPRTPVPSLRRVLGTTINITDVARVGPDRQISISSRVSSEQILAIRATIFHDISATATGRRLIAGLLCHVRTLFALYGRAVDGAGRHRGSICFALGTHTL